MKMYTKGKWIVSKTDLVLIYAINNGSHLVADCRNPHLPNGEDLANARQIVHCVNNFDRLQELASDMVDALYGFKSESGDYYNAEIQKIVAKNERVGLRRLR